MTLLVVTDSTTLMKLCSPKTACDIQHKSPFNWAYPQPPAPPFHFNHFRVSTNLTEQISRRFPGDSRRDFKKNPGHVCFVSACYAMYWIY